MAGKSKKIQDVESKYEQEQAYTQPLSKDNLTDEMFDALDTTKADTLSIMDIRSDITQPRNIVPREVRGTFAGYAEGVPALLDVWHDAVMDEIDDLPIEKILNGRAAAFDFDNGNPLVTGFIELLDLAAQIHDVGLQQPIGVWKLPKNKYEIIYGERRWMAFHTLTHFGIDGYEQIPAKVATTTNEFVIAKIQAAENSQRKQLTAIGMAREFAKLIIRARQDTQKPPYDHWTALVVPGGCNRPWYAQVADGYKHPIPTGMGPIFEQALGISTGQMRNYRALLNMTDDYEINNQLWDMADEGNWAERLLRDIVTHLDLDAIRTILKEAPDPEEIFREAISAANATKIRHHGDESAKQRNVTTVTNPEPDEPEEEGEADEIGAVVTPPAGDWVSLQWVDTYADVAGRRMFVMNAVDAEHVNVRDMVNGNEAPVHISALLPYDEASTFPKPEEWINKRIKTRGGVVGTVVKIEGMYLIIDRDDKHATHRAYIAQHVEVIGVAGVEKENWLGQAVQSAKGTIGLVNEDKATFVRVKWADGIYSNELKSALTRVNYQLWIEATRPKDWTGRYVQTVAGAVAGVVKDYGADVDLIYPDNTQSKSKKSFLSLVEKREWDEAVKRHHKALAPTDSIDAVPTGGNGGSENVTYPAHGLTTVQLVGKPVLYQGQPAVVVGASGSENVVIQLGKERVPVHKDVLVLNNGAMGQRVVDVIDNPVPPATTGEDGGRFVMLPDEEVYKLIGTAVMLAKGFGNEEAVEALNDLRFKKHANREKLGLLMDECLEHLNEIMNATIDRVSQRFDLIWESVSDGTSDD